MGRVQEITSKGRKLPTNATVWIVIVELAVVEPGVTLDGVKVAVAPDGGPETVKTTGLVKAPPCGLTLMV